MAAETDQREAEAIQRLADEAEILVEEDGSKKDLKEQRKYQKYKLFGGVNKLKHTIPMGKHL